MPANSPDPTNARKRDEDAVASNPLDSALPDLSSSGAASGVDPKHALDARLAGELIDGAPSLPADRREAVVALLTGLMADHRRLDDYSGCLKLMLKGAELEGAEPPDGLDVDERDQRIVEEGFAWLPDEELAALAVSRKGLKDLYELLEDPETATAEWLMDAMMAAHADRPEVEELAEYTRAGVARLLAEKEAGD